MQAQRESEGARGVARSETVAVAALPRRYTGFDCIETSASAASRPMSLNVYNTLTRRVEPFVPLEPGHVRMYVCGMTIYDLCHMGHARMMMAFDVVYRWLQA